MAQLFIARAFLAENTENPLLASVGTKYTCCRYIHIGNILIQRSLKIYISDLDIRKLKPMVATM